MKVQHTKSFQSINRLPVRHRTTQQNTTSNPLTKILMNAEELEHSCAEIEIRAEAEEQNQNREIGVESMGDERNQLEMT